MNRITALTVAGALVAAPLATVLAASPASADTTKRGACGQGSYEFQVDREDREDGGGFEVSADLDRARPGLDLDRWSSSTTASGVSKVTRTADNEGELDVDVNRPNTSGRTRSASRPCLRRRRLQSAPPSITVG